MSEKKKCPKFENYIPEEAREHFKVARSEMREGMKTVFPVNFLDHRRAARKEMLLAVKSMVDGALERVEES